MTTTIPVSTVPAVIGYLATAIQAQLNADPDASDIVLSIGEPSQDMPDVYVEIASDVRRTVPKLAEVSGLYANSMAESYDLDIKVSVAQETVDLLQDTLAIVQRCWQIVAYVETAIRLDLTLGNTVLTGKPSQTRGGEARWAPNGVARICEVVVPINCFAIL
jgi:hypothetical protein